jgi:Flp pilus assembly protein TadD
MTLDGVEGPAGDVGPEADDARDQFARRVAAYAKLRPGVPLPEIRARVAAQLREDKARGWNEQKRYLDELNAQVDRWDEVLERALRMVDAGDSANAESLLRASDAEGDGRAAAHLGVLLVRRHEFDEAEAAFRRADHRGSTDGSLNLGPMLEARSDPEGAEDAYCRAEKRGSTDAAVCLGIMLAARDNLEGAEAAFRRADAAGDANGSSRCSKDSVTAREPKPRMRAQTSEETETDLPS